MHICSWAYANNVECMYNSVPGHSVDCIGFIWGIYTDTVVSSAHEHFSTCGIWEAY